MRVRFGSREVECGLVIFDKTGTITDFNSTWIPMIKRRVELLVQHARTNGLESEILTTIGLEHSTWKPDLSGPLMVLADRDLVFVLAFVLYEKGMTWPTALEIVNQSYQQAEKEANRAAEVKLLPGVGEALRRLKKSGIALAVATMDTHAEAEAELYKLGILSLFDAIVAVDDVSKQKPNPEMIEKICISLKMSPERAVLVGDTPSDMIMGKNARVALTVAFAENPTPEIKTAADVTISGYSEICVVDAKN